MMEYKFFISVNDEQGRFYGFLPGNCLKTLENKSKCLKGLHTFGPPFCYGNSSMREALRKRTGR